MSLNFFIQVHETKYLSELCPTFCPTIVISGLKMENNKMTSLNESKCVQIA